MLSAKKELPNQTVCVRMDCVELIYKVQPSVYVVVSMLHINDGEAMLFVNWAHYFDRLQNPQVQMPKIEKCCPTLYAVMTGDDADGVYECDCKPDGTICHGFALKVEVPKMVNHFVDDEHFCYFDDMYSPEYSLQWIYEDIMKCDIDAESRKLLEEGHKEIAQSECYLEYGYPSYYNRNLGRVFSELSKRKE